MNPARRIILALATLALLTVTLIPPWYAADLQEFGREFGTRSSGHVERTYITLGHFPLWNPPGGYRGDVRVDWRRLAVEWAAVVLGGALAFVVAGTLTQMARWFWAHRRLGAGLAVSIVVLVLIALGVSAFLQWDGTRRQQEAKKAADDKATAYYQAQIAEARTKEADAQRQAAALAAEQARQAAEAEARIAEKARLDRERSAHFFDTAIGDAHKIVFVADRSGSMTDSMNYIEYELEQSITKLPEDREFHVIFCSSGPPLEMPAKRLVAATAGNKQQALAFIGGVIAQGETDPTKALKSAFALGPDVVFILSDGEFDPSIIGLVNHLNLVNQFNGGGKAVVHTIGFLYTKPGTNSEKNLKTIAAQNGGQYKFVSEADLPQ